ncbi:hypothetical protein D3C72_2487620 [compost metagenome]
MGRDSGSMILMRMPSSEQPSNRADSRKLMGIPWKKLRIRMSSQVLMAKGSISAQTVSTRCNERITK